ncbi:MAG: hypothetical protein E7500_01245 [Ruminococcus sp.]|nr:hypothetical protein [Ruminococcus sp.]
MNKQTKLVVSVLFVVIAVLAVGIISFRISTSGGTDNNSAQTEITRKLAIDASGNRIFEGDGGLYGIVDHNDKVIVAPEWTELEFADGSLCIASKRINGRMLSGCIDYEGNVMIPLIYRNITRHGTDNFTFYVAEADSDSSCIIYNENFIPLFNRSWESFSVSGQALTLASENDSFEYTFGDNGLVCSHASVYNEVMGCGFTLNISSRVLLSKLDCSSIEYMADGVSAYLEYAYTGNYEAVKELAKGNPGVVLTGLFPDDTRITSRRLLGISSISIYSEKTDSGVLYYNIAVTADTRIGYTGENNRYSTITDEYKAVVRFSQPDPDVSIISGLFTQTQPDYPDAELLEQETESSAE